MQIELTPKQVSEMGKMWGEIFLKKMPVEERLADLKLEERLAGLNLEEMKQLEKCLKGKIEGNEG